MTPNRAAQENGFALAIKRDGRPVTGADVTAKFAMLDMEMGQQAYALKETAPGVYSARRAGARDGRSLGHRLRRQPPGGEPFDVVLVDRANG